MTEKDGRNKRSIKCQHQAVKALSSLSLFLTLEDFSSIQTRRAMAGAIIKNSVSEHRWVALKRSAEVWDWWKLCQISVGQMGLMRNVAEDTMQAVKRPSRCCCWVCDACAAAFQAQLLLPLVRNYREAWKEATVNSALLHCLRGSSAHK